jgi:pyruvate kinase
MKSDSTLPKPHSTGSLTSESSEKSFSSVLHQLWSSKNPLDARTLSQRKTKIVATLGPSSRAPEKIKELISAGANVFRLNFSHGSHEEHLAVLKDVRTIAKEMGAHIAILQDLSGPKIRISNVDGDFCPIHDGQSIELRVADKSLSNAQTIYVETVNPIKTLLPGHHVLLADGLIELVAEEVSTDHVTCRVIKGGRIRSRVGIAFPDSDVDLPATTKKDLVDLEWGITNGVDYVAISFVRSASDVLSLREIINQRGAAAGIIAKIERRTALENIEEIVRASDGLMVARGDLGLEVPLEQLPMLQRKLIEEANFRGIPVIVATQMMHSMITSVRPTRAEVSDIAAAVMGGADAVMLSDETAIGEHPAACVGYLSRIALAAEQTFAFEEYKLRLRNSDTLTVPDAIAYAACAASIKTSADALIACTETGTSARLVAKYRPQQPLYGVSRNETTLRRMALYWGVKPCEFESARNHTDEIERALEVVQDLENLPNGSRAVVTGGRFTQTPGSTSVLEVRELNYRAAASV